MRPLKLLKVLALKMNLIGNAAVSFLLLISLSAIGYPSDLVSVNAQTRLATEHRSLRAALDRDDTAQAITILQDLSRREPAAFSRNHYDYLLARLHRRHGNHTEARRLFHQVAQRGSILTAYALWHLAELARLDGQHKDEQRHLAQIVGRHPGFLHRRTVLDRLATSYLATGQHELAINTLRSISATRGSASRENLARIGTAQAALAQIEAARTTLNAVIASGQLDDASLRAATSLDEIDERLKAAIPDIERLRRARIYQYNRDFASARKHWRALVDSSSQPPVRREALFQLGRGFYQELNHTEALRWYQRTYDEFPASEEGEQGFYFVGHCHQALNQPDKAIARYEAFIRQFPEADHFAYAFLNAIDTLRQAGLHNAALKWTSRAEAEAKDSFVVTRALFDRVRIRLSEGNYAAALTDLTALGSRNLAQRGLVASTNAAEIGFLRALCYEQLGRYEEAIAAYLAFSEGRNDAAGYYGFQATNRLRALGHNLRAKNLILARLESSVSLARAAAASGDARQMKSAALQALRLTETVELRREMLTILRRAYADLPGYSPTALILQPAGRTIPLGDEPNTGQSVADELLFLGLYDEGASELVAERPTGQGANARNWAYTLAVYCGRGDCPDRTLKFADPILNTLPSDYRLELLPRDLAEVFYPLSFRESMSLHATTRNVDPRLVLSIARQESRYDPDVKSYAAARGLLQFISSTSLQIATQLNLRDFDQSDLYRPESAILLGSQYLKNLLDEFKTPQAAAAAYNGSEDSVRRWIARSRSTDVDRFVIEIAKGQTKDYVYKVMNNYRAYQAIYP